MRGKTKFLCTWCYWLLSSKDNNINCICCKHSSLQYMLFNFCCDVSFVGLLFNFILIIFFPQAFILIDTFFSFKYLLFLLVDIHPGCAEFLLPTALFAYTPSIVPVSLYPAAAKHSGALLPPSSLLN